MLCVLTAGCMEHQCARPWEDLTQKPRMQAFYTAEPVQVDGVLDEAVWQKAQSYSLAVPRDRLSQGQPLREGGKAMLAWDRDYFYIGVTYYDTDIKAEGVRDHEHHYQLGDVCEVFLRPAGQTYYWEMYVTPKGHKTCFFFPIRAAEIQVDEQVGLDVAAGMKGTLNNPGDMDEYWTGEMRISRKDLGKYCNKFGPGTTWRILVARYNYSDYLAEPNPELSAAPPLSKTRYHFHEEYAVIDFVK